MSRLMYAYLESKLDLEYKSDGPSFGWLSPEVVERIYAPKVLRLIGHGKHWILVTLSLSIGITSQTLPNILDRCSW